MREVLAHIPTDPPLFCSEADNKLAINHPARKLWLGACYRGGCRIPREIGWYAQAFFSMLNAIAFFQDFVTTGHTTPL